MSVGGGNKTSLIKDGIVIVTFLLSLVTYGTTFWASSDDDAQKQLDEVKKEVDELQLVLVKLQIEFARHQGADKSKD